MCVPFLRLPGKASAQALDAGTLSRAGPTAASLAAGERAFAFAACDEVARVGACGEAAGALLLDGGVGAAAGRVTPSPIKVLKTPPRGLVKAAAAAGLGIMRYRACIRDALDQSKQASHASQRCSGCMVYLPVQVLLHAWLEPLWRDGLTIPHRGLATLGLHAAASQTCATHVRQQLYVRNGNRLPANSTASTCSLRKISIGGFHQCTYRVSAALD